MFPTPDERRIILLIPLQTLRCDVILVTSEWVSQKNKCFSVRRAKKKNKCFSGKNGKEKGKIMAHFRNHQG